MDGLNPAQREAVQTLRGPLLVLAGAGTGKTRVVTVRIGLLIKSGIAAERILAVTFTNKAANEMRERVVAQIGKRKAKPLVATFHSLCVRILRRQITALGYPAKFAIYTRSDQESIITSVMKEIRVRDASLKPADLLFQIGSWKSRALTPEQAAISAQSDKEHLAASVYRRYQRELKNRGVVDFDDLLLLTEKLFREHPAILEQEATQFDHLLIDEYQDTNQSQYRIAKALVAKHRNLCVVGDDDQSIYAWRGAEVQHILRFHLDWPDAKVVRLEMNYRSTGPIIEWSNRLIDFNVVRHGKVLQAARPNGPPPEIHQYKDETKEAQDVVFHISQRLQSPGVEPNHIAVLFRTNEQPRVFETEFRKRGIPYILIGTQSFFDRREVKDLLSYLQVLVTPNDEVALLRIINSPKRGIGSTVVEKLRDAAIRSGRDTWEVMNDPAACADLKTAAKQAVFSFCELIRELQTQLGQMTVRPLLELLVQRVGFRTYLESLYTEPDELETRWNNVAGVINAAAEFDRDNGSQGTLVDFLSELTLGDRDAQNDKEKQLQRRGVVLMTLHSAKGLEFHEVYMVGMEEGILPHKRSLETEEAIAEERRLCYVGMTRAQLRLTLSLPLSRKKWGRDVPTVPSRFLYEMIGKAENPKHLQRKK
jgi:DNA helicase II / ATP-dependent DNA helicase PcrA